MNEGFPAYYRPALAVSFLSNCLSFAFILLAPLLSSLGGMTTTQAALFQGAAFLIAGVFQPFVGSLLDQRRHMPVVALAAVGITAGTVSLMFNGLRPAVLLAGSCALIVGFTTLFTIQSLCLIGLVKPELRARAANTYYLLHCIGLGSSCVMAFLLMEHHRRLLLGLDLVTTLAVLATFAVIVIRRRRDPSEAGRPRASFPEQMDVVRRNLTPFIGVLLLFTALYFAQSAIPLIYQARGADTIRLTSVVLLVNIIVVGGLMLIPTKRSQEDLIPSQAQIGLALLGLGLLVVPFALSNSSAAASAVLWSAGEALLSPLLSVTVYRLAADAKPGLVSGLSVSIKTGSSMLAPLVACAVLKVGAPVQAAALVAVPLVGAVMLAGTKGLLFKTSVAKGEEHAQHVA